MTARKTKPTYNTTTTKPIKITYKLDQEPDAVREEKLKHFSKPISKPIVYKLDEDDDDYTPVEYEHNVTDIDDRGVIEVPIDADTVIYTDEDGNNYEVDVDDLIEYDGDDGDITYHSKAAEVELGRKVVKKKKISKLPSRNTMYMVRNYMQAFYQRVR